MSRWLIIGLYQELLLVSSSRKTMNSNILNRKMRSWWKALRLVGLKKEHNIVKGTIGPRYGWFGSKVWEGARLLLCSGRQKNYFQKWILIFLPSERYFAFKTTSFNFLIIHYLLSFLEMTVIDPQKEGSN